jgi:hypothetical protein
MNRACTESAGRVLARTPVRARSEPAAARRRLEIATDGSWFALGGRSVDLSKRRVLRTVLLALSEQHRRAPGVGVSSDELVDRIWIGERMQRESGLNRLYVAMSTLRALGLSEVVYRQTDGYLIDPSVTVRRV